MQKGRYRKLHKGICDGCDHPAYAPSKNVNPNTACRKCWKNQTKRDKEWLRKIKQGIGEE